MNDWLKQAFHEVPDQPLTLDVVAGRLVVAFVLGCLVAATYKWTYRRDEPPAPSMYTTLLMLAVLIALVTQVIGHNAARAFSLAGALAIIRFRTVVEDTRDTAFVIFAVVIGMTAGAGYVLVAVVGLAIAAAAAALLRPGKKAERVGGKFWALSVRVGFAQSSAVSLDSLLAKHLEEWQQLAAATGRQGAALDLTYRVRLRPNTTATALVSDLNQVEGVQSVELRQL